MRWQVFALIVHTSLSMLHDHEDPVLHVPILQVRQDYYTGEVVSRGRFEILGGFHHKPVSDGFRKISLDEFKKALQCSPRELTFESSGGYQMTKILPLSKGVIELMCTWAESQCQPWIECQKISSKFKDGDYEANINILHYMSDGGQYQIKMFRIMNGKLYMDWPWGMDRFQRPYASVSNSLLFLTNIIADLPDSVFFMGLERSFLPWNFPFLGFSNSPSLDSADIPFPWWSPVHHEIETYRKAISFYSNQVYKRDISDVEKEVEIEDLYSNNIDKKKELIQDKINKRIQNEFIIHKDTYHQFTNQFQRLLPWKDKKSKGAFYGSLSPIRHIFFDIAITRPDLFDVGWTGDYGIKYGTPWNPMSMEQVTNENPIDINEYNEIHKDDTHAHEVLKDVGYFHHLYSHHLKQGKHVNLGEYKYLIVLTGLNGNALADRLSLFLSYSNAVILLQDSTYKYHFSSQFKPWVHYVPISYSTGDIIDKIEWLQKHDHIAEKIANNGKVFADSYLRLEDHFCYIATALEGIGKLLNSTSYDALDPFNPIPFLPGKENEGW